MTSAVTPRRGDLSPGASRYFDGPDWGWAQLWLTGTQVVDVCRDRFGLDASRADLLAEGLLNQTWRITCQDGSRRVLRVSRPERTPEQVAYEFTVATAWAAVVPEVVAAVSDDVSVVDDHVVTMFPFVDGVSGTEVDPTVRARRLATVLPRLHRVSLDLGLPQRPGFTSIDDHPRWFGWERTRVAITERFGRGTDVRTPIDTVDRAIAELDDLLDRWQREGRLGVRATVHGDLNSRNQLYRDDRLVGLIDTDDCRVEPLIWDVANVAYSDPAVSPARVWRDYLEAGGPLADADEELLVHFARIGALTELVWLTHDNGEATHLAAGSLRDLAGQLTGEVTRDG